MTPAGRQSSAMLRVCTVKASKATTAVLSSTVVGVCGEEVLFFKIWAHLQAEAQAGRVVGSGAARAARQLATVPADLRRPGTPASKSRLGVAVKCSSS